MSKSNNSECSINDEVGKNIVQEFMQPYMRIVDSSGILITFMTKRDHRLYLEERELKFIGSD
jgi:hypothetical protein